MVQSGHIYQWVIPSWEGTEDFLIEIPQIISVGSHDRDENGDRWKQLVYKAPVARGHLIEPVDISDFTDNHNEGCILGVALLDRWQSGQFLRRFEKCFQ